MVCMVCAESPFQSFHMTGKHNNSRRNGEENDNNSWRESTFGGLEEASLLCKFIVACIFFHVKPEGTFQGLCWFFSLQVQACIGGTS